LASLGQGRAGSVLRIVAEPLGRLRPKPKRSPAGGICHKTQIGVAVTRGGGPPGKDPRGLLHYNVMQRDAAGGHAPARMRGARMNSSLKMGANGWRMDPVRTGRGETNQVRKNRGPIEKKGDPPAKLSDTQAMLCQPHLSRGVSVRATRTVASTPMCESCFAGRAVAPEELAGDVGDGADRVACRAYYQAHRDEVLATHRRWRDTRRLDLCSAD
jgi:hypothetical protein